MSKLEIQSAKLKKEFTTANGTMYSYTLIGLLDGEMDSVEMNFKSPANAPLKGDVLEVTVEDTQWGKKAKKVQQNMFKGGFQPRSEDPEKQAMIVRQNALTNAVSFLSTLATLEKDPKVLTTDSVLLIATKFAKFSQGEITLEAKAVAITSPPKRTATEVIGDEWIGGEAAWED